MANECTGCRYDFDEEQEDLPTGEPSSRCPDCGDCEDCCRENHGGEPHPVGGA